MLWRPLTGDFMAAFEFVPSAVEDANAHAAFAKALARSLENWTLPMPPQGLPALRPVHDESPLMSASVLGYLVQEGTIHDCIGPGGEVALPGAQEFDAVTGAVIAGQPLPAGWSFVARPVRLLLAVVDGNPVALESQAHALGYSYAVATAPHLLTLGELPADAGALIDAVQSAAHQ